ncbi:MAG: endolytic transglycosylase MltG [Clostridia bacterium]|nr:endolytic transglycosylase MltG [Clostridia bacterium]
MKNFHIKSLLLGLGLGVILTSMISMIYMAGANPGSALSRNEIIEAAKQYGMVESSELIKKESPKLLAGNDPEKDEKKSETVEPVEPKDKAKKPEPTPIPPEVSLSINSGDTPSIVADKLLKEGLIPSKEAFIGEMVKAGKTNGIVVGQYKIKRNTAIIDIIHTIAQ